MGARLVALVPQEKDMRLAAALEHPAHPALGRDVGAANKGPEVGVIVGAQLPDGLDVLIDFSTPESTAQRARECAAKKVALVVGTTGLNPAQTRTLTRAARQVPCLAAPNMSLGVNLLFQIAPKVAAALGDEYDIEIVEAHHRFKKDSPSGTALRLAEEIARALKRDLQECLNYGRKGVVGERPRRQIGIHAVRAGDIVGDHTVLFSSLGERIELVHRAHSRDTFCRGAIAAARFLVGKEPGMYRMADVLGLS
jgi:4-hydroxy-tetrahydrodipicolinate reductase